MSSVFTDVVTRDDVPATLPRLVSGQRLVMSMPAEQEVRDLIVDLVCGGRTIWARSGRTSTTS